MANPWLRGDPESVLVADGVALLSEAEDEVLADGVADALGVTAGW
ncbi:MAG TPA: hypothetical protein VG268_00655 [Streptosporangiaceae bacterium]|nr:hypothetical protein [Streptosporangiaceae bacterium]